MSLEEFRAWERKCLTEAVTNAARLRSQQKSPVPASGSSPDHAAGHEADDERSADQAGRMQQEG